MTINTEPQETPPPEASEGDETPNREPKPEVAAALPTDAETAVPEDSHADHESDSPEEPADDGDSDMNPFAPTATEPSAAEREYRAALEAARALGLDTVATTPPASAEEEEAARLVSALGLDQSTDEPEEALPVLDEPEEAADEESEEDDFLGPEPTDGRAWYVLNTYSGHENRVKENLERRSASMDVADRIHRVVVPTEEELEIRGGQRRQVQRKLLPGYVLVEMLLDNATWYVVRNTPGVTGFVGSDEPSPLPREEVKSILRQMRVVEPRVRVGFELGDTVRVTDGPFMDFMAQVDEINLEKGKVRALISMFGRETPVELDFIQVEKV